MTGYNIYKRVCSLLGYNEDENTHNVAKAQAMTEIINRIMTDLKENEIENLSSVFNIEKEKEDALIYGCAMLLAVTMNDAAHAKVFSVIYNAKRSTSLAGTDIRVDVLPKPINGGI